MYKANIIDMKGHIVARFGKHPADTKAHDKSP
jgi:hypothetical protein